MHKFGRLEGHCLQVTVSLFVIVSETRWMTGIGRLRSDYHGNTRLPCRCLAQLESSTATISNKDAAHALIECLANRTHLEPPFGLFSIQSCRLLPYLHSVGSHPVVADTCVIQHIVFDWSSVIPMANLR